MVPSSLYQKRTALQTDQLVQIEEQAQTDIVRVGNTLALATAWIARDITLIGQSRSDAHLLQFGEQASPITQQVVRWRRQKEWAEVSRDL